MFVSSNSQLNQGTIYFTVANAQEQHFCQTAQSNAERNFKEQLNVAEQLLALAPEAMMQSHLGIIRNLYTATKKPYARTNNSLTSATYT